MSLGKRLRDIALEVLIAVVLVSGLLFYAANSAGRNHRRDFVLGAIVINTALVFGYLLSWFRFAFRNMPFWITLAGLLLAHGVGYILIFPRLDHVGTIYYCMADMAEWTLFSRILQKVLQRWPEPARPHLVSR
jgi:cytochrome bd-type quinol oxidase subunit 2